jgi:hypothetical protein
LMPPLPCTLSFYARCARAFRVGQVYHDANTLHAAYFEARSKHFGEG